MSIDLQRAIDDAEYRERVAGLDDPLVTFLRRAGVYAYDEYDWAPASNWNGPSVGAEPGEMKRGAIQPDPSMTFEELRPLLDLGPRARVVLAKHPSTPLEHLRALAEDEDRDVQLAVFTSPNWGDELLALLAHSKFPLVRQTAANHPRLPLALVEKLLVDPVEDVRATAARRPEHDSAALARILERDPERSHEIVSHQNVTPALLLQLARTADEYTREAITWNRTAPTEALELIAAQPRTRRINLGLASNPATPMHVLLGLAEDREDEVRKWVAARLLHHAATGEAKKE